MYFKTLFILLENFNLLGKTEKSLNKQQHQLCLRTAK